MKSLRVENLTHSALVVDRGWIADTMWTRMVGLLRHKKLDAGEGLWITPCNSIHSLGMKFVFDAVFLSKTGEVVALREKVPPGRFLAPIWKAHSVLELPGGAIEASRIQIGDQLKLEADFSEESRNSG